METYLAYFDETGDDGMVKYSCDHFVLTSVYMPVASWQTNFDAFRAMRRELRDMFGLHVTEEFHTKHFLTDKNPLPRLSLDATGETGDSQTLHDCAGLAGYAVYQRDY